MSKTPSKMHMYDMVKIDTIVFEIVSCLKYPGSDRVKRMQPIYSYLFYHWRIEGGGQGGLAPTPLKLVKG